MQVGLGSARNGEEEVKAANYSQIRFFSVAAHTHTTTRIFRKAPGKLCRPRPPTGFRQSRTTLPVRSNSQIHVPIGLVVDALGGTPAEAWTSAEALRPLKDFDVPLAELQRLAAAGAPEYGSYVMHWYDQYDVGLKGNWAAPDLDDSTWKTVDIPSGFAELGVPDTPALVWFRREIVLPDPLPAGRALIFLGSIERMDTVYINGRQVGASAWVENPRVYFIPDGLLKPGRNVVAIRVLKTKPQGGFLGKPEELHLTLGDKTSIPLAGKWKGQLSVDARPRQPLPIS
jgi:sialate O-acetylesterase